MESSTRVYSLVIAVIFIIFGATTSTLEAKTSGEYDSVLAQIRSNAEHLISANKFEVMSEWGSKLPFYYSNLRTFHKLIARTMESYVKKNRERGDLAVNYQSFLLMSKEVDRIGLNIDLNNDYSVENLYQYNKRVKGCYEIMMKSLQSRG